MARSSEELPVFAGSGSPAVLLPLRHGFGVRVAEFAVLLVRAIAIVLLLSPVFVTAALLLG